MFKKILLPFDGSEHSMKAADYAIELAQLDGAQVEILYVSPSVEHYMRDSAVLIDSLETAARENAEEIIAMATDKFKDSGVHYTTTIKTGNAAAVICSEAEQNGIKIIVMGSRGLNPAMDIILGSVSNRVISHAHCPVIIVR